MPDMKLKHYDHDGRARFVTFCTHKRIPVLTNTPFRKIIVECLEEVRKNYNLRLLGYVIMPEHVHLVVVPPKELKFGPVIGELKHISAKRIHELLSGNTGDLIHRLTAMRNGRQRFALWQRRCFDHNCRSDESVWEKVEYCHNNPVTRGLVSKPDDWKWSSCRWYEGRQDAALRMDVAIAE
jgi:putative transposase